MTCEYPKVFTETKRKARKEHNCCECCKTIRPGDMYVAFSGIWDKPRTYKTCERCDKLRRTAIKKYPPMYPDEWPVFGELREWIGECKGLIKQEEEDREDSCPK